jgi:hypothetical protein
VFVTEGLGFVVQLHGIGFQVTGELVVGLVGVLCVVFTTFTQNVGDKEEYERKQARVNFKVIGPSLQ